MRILKIFESYYEDLSNIDEYIDEICDSFDIVKVYYNDISQQVVAARSSKEELEKISKNKFIIHEFENDRTGSNIKYDIFFDPKYNDDMKIHLYRLVKKLIDNSGYLKLNNNIIYFKKEIDIDEYFSFYNGTPKEMSGIKIVIPFYKKNIYDDLIYSYDKNKSEIIDYVSSIDPNVFVKHYFDAFCRRHGDWDFDIFSGYKKEDRILDPISADSIRMPMNLDKQFIFDITPYFFKKLYNSSNLIFRLSHNKYDTTRITNHKRLDKTSVKEEMNNVLEELNLNFKWNDIFVQQEIK